jgi:hypothetical protein
MIALGYSLWQVARADAATQPTAVDTPLPARAGVE